MSFGRARGVTIAEAAMATIIVAGVLVTALTTVAASRTTRARAADRARAQQLAMDLMAEILQQSYQPAQTAENSRPSWTDVDHYNGLVDSPPQTKSGSTIPDCSNWSRTALVEWIDPNTLGTSSSTNTGIKRITVNVVRGSLVLATVAACRTSGWVDDVPKPTDTTGHHPPSASATGSPLSGSGGHLTVTFNGGNSSSPDGSTLSYVWNFGDGTSASGPTLSHNYVSAGTYTATLTVYDGWGGVGLGSVNVTVNP